MCSRSCLRPTDARPIGASRATLRRGFIQRGNLSAQNRPGETGRRFWGCSALLRFIPTSLLRQSNLSPRRLAMALLELDLAGRIDRHDDERISLKLVQIYAD